MERTDKCKLITEEMSWREILTEFRKIESSHKDVMSLSASERALIGFALFSENRHQIIESLPKDLSEKEFKRQLYFRTYGEHLPEDFLRKMINLRQI